MTTIRHKRFNIVLLAATCSLVISCGAYEFGPTEGEARSNAEGKADSSAIARFLEVEFDGEVQADWAFMPEKTIEDQLLYTVGQLNGDNSVSRIDRLELTNVQSSMVDERYHITYHARTVVAWGKDGDIPQSYTFVLPKDMSYSAQSAFIEKHKESCVDWSAHDVDSSTMWYYWRPEAFGCELEQDEVIRVTASVKMSDIATTGKYPEYHKIWEDDVFRVVAVFSQYDEVASDYDSGISAYNTFVSEIRQALENHNLSTQPPTIPPFPGAELPDVELKATLPDGKQVEVVALLVSSISSASHEFNQRYEALSGNADLISYSGHSGLGANIRALARKGRWIQGQYVVVFMNGCDTYAYVDSALSDAHAAVNPDDPLGTKYVDVVTNAMPSYFSNMPHATMALLRGLMDHEAPKTYEQIFQNISSSQVVLVSGEEDNVYVPGYVDQDNDDNDG